MKLITLRNNLKKLFNQNGIDATDVDFIVSECLGVNRNELALIEQVSNVQAKKINKCATLRLKHKPIDAIFGYSYFYGCKFKVNKYVLTPRQDSEILIETAQNIINQNGLKSVLDLCTGSGCLAITISKLTGAEVVATDISAKALKVAKYNQKQIGTNVKFLKSDLFKKVNNRFDLIVSNPPYIETETINSLDIEVKKYDPIIALDGGADGLDFYKQIAQQIQNYINSKGYIILEIGYNQKQKVVEIFKNYKFINCIKDFGGNDRVLVFRSKL